MEQLTFQDLEIGDFVWLWDGTKEPSQHHHKKRKRWHLNNGSFKVTDRTSMGHLQLTRNSNDPIMRFHKLIDADDAKALHLYRENPLKETLT
ncbi:hypothetical protein [Vibrio mediterranei]|uniref:hypothetical protein n=1 Tax=Vibrio mediterranei TaxID=689 RepID=UPI004068223C